MEREMSFSEAIKSVFSNYANFNGRARRKEFWYFALFTFILSCIPVINFIAWLICIVPSIAVGVRRLHDTGRNGLWILLSLIPIVHLILLVFYVQDSQPGENEWGANPKGL